MPCPEMGRCADFPLPDFFWISENKGRVKDPPLIDPLVFSKRTALLQNTACRVPPSLNPGDRRSPLLFFFIIPIHFL